MSRAAFTLCLRPCAADGKPHRRSEPPESENEYKRGRRYGRDRVFYPSGAQVCQSGVCGGVYHHGQCRAYSRSKRLRCSFRNGAGGYAVCHEKDGDGGVERRDGEIF